MRRAFFEILDFGGFQNDRELIKALQGIPSRPWDIDRRVSPAPPMGANPCQALYYFSLYVAFYLTRVIAMGQTLCVRQSPKCQAQTVGKV